LALPAFSSFHSPWLNSYTPRSDPTSPSGCWPFLALDSATECCFPFLSRLRDGMLLFFLKTAVLTFLVLLLCGGALIWFILVGWVCLVRYYPLFFSSFRLIFYLFSVLSLGKSAFLILLGAWAFLGRMGRPVVWKQCFSRIVMSKSMVYGV